MARTSRKAAAQTVAPIEQITTYNTALYVRLSVMDSGKKDGESILNQQEFLEQYVAERPELSLKSTFVDNGETGVDFARPAWNDLMRECRAGRINCIVIKDLSRLGRNYIETGEYLEKIFPLLGVRLIAVNDRYDNQNVTNSGQLVLNLKNLVNDIYSRDISRKVAAAVHSRQKQGLFSGAYPMYGYLKDPTDKHKIIVDPETAPIVRQIFQWKADGMGSAAICRRLDEAGIPSPNRYRLMKGIVKNRKYESATWAVPTIRHILECPMYLGHMTQGKQTKSVAEGRLTKKNVQKSDWVIVENTHEPILSQELFDLAQSVMETRAESYHSVQGKNKDVTAPQILRGLVFCGDCGRPLSRNKKVKDNVYVYWTYQCTSHNTLMTCPRKYIHEADLNNAVYNAIRLEIQKCADVGGIIEKLNGENGHKARLAKFDTEIEEAQRETKRVLSLRQAVYEDYATKLLTVSEYQFAIKKYDTEIEKLKLRLDAAQRDKAEYTQASTPTNKWLAAFSRFMDAKELTTEMAQALIERIEVSSYNRVAIIFKFRDELAAINEYMGVA